MPRPSVEFPRRHQVDVNVTLSPNAGLMSDLAYRSVFAPGLFAGRRVWVTGGGSGIGRCVAHELAALGADVVVSGRSADKLERVAAEIAEDGGRCTWRAF